MVLSQEETIMTWERKVVTCLRPEKQATTLRSQAYLNVIDLKWRWIAEAFNF